MMTNKEYIAGFKNNDNGIIESFYRSFRDQFFSFFRFRYRKDTDYLSDLYSDSCVALWRNIQQGKIDDTTLKSSLITYLIAIGKYKMMAQDRQNRSIPVDDERLLDGLVGVPVEDGSLHEREALFEYVYKTAREMKPPCGEILPAFYWDKLSMKEIADKYNYSGDSSVKVQMFKCRKKMRTLVENYLKK